MTSQLSIYNRSFALGQVQEDFDVRILMNRFSLLVIIGLMVTACGVHRQSAVYRQAEIDPNYKSLRGHFPDSTDALIEVTYWPMEMQGGSVFHAEFANPHVLSVWNDNLGKFSYTYDGPIDGWIEDGKNINKSIPLPQRYVNGNKCGFSSDWKVGVITAIPYTNEGDFIWNHGEMNGIAVNIKEQRVVYFAETW